MPRGDNQHQFTCSDCSVRKPKADRCFTTGKCIVCCDGTGCESYCGTCGQYYYNCRIVSASVPERQGCWCCGSHRAPSCRPRTGRHPPCTCRECPSCGVFRVGAFFYSGSRTPAGHQCTECHANSASTAPCFHCPSCNCLSSENPARRCCGYCSACCVQRGCNGKTPVEYFQMPMDKLADGTQVPVIQHSKRDQFKFMPSKRTVGIEVECTAHIDGVRIVKAVKDIGGAIVRDGTVEFEINTPPINGDKLVHAIAYLSDELVESGAKAAANAGTHIHVGCMDMEYADVRRMVILYGRLESGLYSIISPSRLTGTYSKPNGGRSLVQALSDPSTAKEDLIKMTYGRPPDRQIKTLMRAHKPGNRYWGMNLHSWFYRGTVEFRMHHGTIQWWKMIGYSMLLTAICDGALRFSEKEITEWPQGKEGLLKIAPTDWCKDYVKERWAHFASKRKNKDEPIADF